MDNFGISNITCSCIMKVCGQVIPAPETFNVTFPIGAVLYNCNAAQKGTLERIVIKKYHIIANRKTYGQIVTMYVDTLNGL